MPFPSQYKKSLLSGKKNTTIRIGAECGKYQKGKTYGAGSYAGADWNIEIRITSVTPTIIKELKTQGIPGSVVSSILKQKGVSEKTKADLIRFSIKNRVMKKEVSKLKRPQYPMPVFIKKALTESKTMEAYKARPPYQRNDYIGWITRAKQEETKKKRMEQMLEELKRGDRYMKMCYNAKQ